MILNTAEGDENGEWNWQQRRTSQSRSRSRSSRPKQQRIEPHQNAAPAVPQPPKERPDKNHHLKVKRIPAGPKGAKSS